jgi:hypothetical protein
VVSAHGDQWRRQRCAEAPKPRNQADQGTRSDLWRRVGRVWEQGVASSNLAVPTFTGAKSETPEIRPVLREWPISAAVKTSLIPAAAETEANA